MLQGFPPALEHGLELTRIGVGNFDVNFGKIVLEHLAEQVQFLGCELNSLHMPLVIAQLQAVPRPGTNRGFAPRANAGARRAANSLPQYSPVSARKKVVRAARAKDSPAHTVPVNSRPP